MRSVRSPFWGMFALAAVPLLVLGVFFVLPVAAMVSRGFVVDGHVAPGAVLEVLARPRIARVVWFTAWSAFAGTTLSLALGLPAAYTLYRLRFPGRGAVRALLLVPFVLPTVVVGVAFRELLGEAGPLGFLGLDGTPVAILAGLAFFNITVVVRMVGASWESMDPRPGQAAAALGAGPAQVFRTVTLPALRPAIVGAASVVFLFCATSFGVVLVLGGVRYATIETEIYLLTTNLLDLQAAAALSILQLLAVVGLLMLSRRTRPADPTRAIEPRPPAPPTRRDLPALAITAAAVLFVTAPIAGLVMGSLREDGEWSLRYYRALGQPEASSGLTASEALRNSLVTAVDATWLAVGLGLLIAVLATRRSRSPGERRVRAFLDGLFMLPLGVSAVTLGFGFLIALDRPPVDLRDHPMLVPIAQALVALPLVVRTLAPALEGIDDRLRQAAASLGATPVRAWASVDVPVMYRPVLAAIGFAYAVSLGEFGATAFLARDDHPTLPVMIFRLLGQPGEDHYGRALAAAVVLGAVTAAVIFVVERLRVRGVGAF